MPVRGLRKWHRVWNLAEKRHQKPKEKIRGYCGSRKRVTVAGRRNVSCRAEVAWRKRNSIRKDWTTDKVEREAQRARMVRRLWSCQENGKGIRDLGGRQPLYRRKRRPTKDSICRCKSGHRSPLGSRGTRKKALYEIVCMKIAQKTAKIFGKTRRLEVAK
jgi:hypothetical protein